MSLTSDAHHMRASNSGLPFLRLLPLDSKRIERGADISSDHVILARILVANLRILLLRMALASGLLVARFLAVARDLVARDLIV
jgi:hypothetical protein